MKWTEKFRKKRGNEAKTSSPENEPKHNEGDYNLSGEYVSGKVTAYIREEYNPSEGDYNLGESYVTSEPPKPIGSVAWEKETFDPRNVKEEITEIFTSKKFKGFQQSGCATVIAFVALCSMALAASWPRIIRSSQESGLIAVAIIAAVVLISIFAFTTRTMAYKVSFCLTAKKNVFVLIEETENKKTTTQLLRYNYFISENHSRYSIYRTLVLVANDTDYNTLSFEGFLENNFANVKQPISFVDNYAARFEAEKCSPMIEKIIGLLDSSNLAREQHLR